MNCTIFVAKTKALVSFAVTSCRVSLDATRIVLDISKCSGQLRAILLMTSGFR